MVPLRMIDEPELLEHLIKSASPITGSPAACKRTYAPKAVGRAIQTSIRFIGLVLGALAHFTYAAQTVNPYPLCRPPRQISPA